MNISEMQVGKVYATRNGLFWKIEQMDRENVAVSRIGKRRRATIPLKHFAALVYCAAGPDAAKPESEKEGEQNGRT